MDKSRSIRGMRKNKANMEESEDSPSSIERLERAHKLLNLEKEIVRPRFFQDTNSAPIPKLRRSIVTRAYQNQDQNFKSSTPFIGTRHPHGAFFPSERSSGSISPVRLTDSESEKTLTDKNSSKQEEDILKHVIDSDKENGKERKSRSQGNFITNAKLIVNSVNCQENSANLQKLKTIDVSDRDQNSSKITKTPLNKYGNDRRHNTVNSIQKNTDCLPENSIDNLKEQNIVVDKPKTTNTVAVDNSNDDKIKKLDIVRTSKNKSSQNVNIKQLKPKLVKKKKILRKNVKAKTTQRSKQHQTQTKSTTVERDEDTQTELTKKHDDKEISNNLPNDEGIFPIMNMENADYNQQMDKSVLTQDIIVQQDANESAKSRFVANLELSPSVRLSERRDRNSQNINKTTEQNIDRNSKNYVNKSVQSRSNQDNVNRSPRRNVEENRRRNLDRSATRTSRCIELLESDKNNPEIEVNRERNMERSLKRNSRFAQLLEQDRSNRHINRSLQRDVEEVNRSVERTSRSVEQFQCVRSNQNIVNRSSQRNIEKSRQGNSRFVENLEHDSDQEIAKKSTGKDVATSISVNDLMKHILLSKSVSSDNRNISKLLEDIQKNLTRVTTGVDYGSTASDGEVPVTKCSTFIANRRPSSVSSRVTEDEKVNKIQRLDNIILNLSTKQQNSTKVNTPKLRDLKNYKLLIDKESQTSVKESLRKPEQSPEIPRQVTRLEINQENANITDESNSSRMLQNTEDIFNHFFESLSPELLTFTQDYSFENVSNAEGPWRADDEVTNILSQQFPNRLSTKLNFLKPAAEIETSKSNYPNCDPYQTRPSTSEQSLRELPEQRRRKHYYNKKMSEKISVSNQNESSDHDNDDIFTESSNLNDSQRHVEEVIKEWSEGSESDSEYENRKRSEQKVYKKKGSNKISNCATKTKMRNRITNDSESELSQNTDSEYTENDHENHVGNSKSNDCNTRGEKDKSNVSKYSTTTIPRINGQIVDDVSVNKKNNIQQEINLNKQNSFCKTCDVRQNQLISRKHNSYRSISSDSEDQQNTNQEIRKRRETLKNRTENINTPENCRDYLTEGIIFRDIWSMDLERAAKEKIVNLLLSSNKMNDRNIGNSTDEGENCNVVDDVCQSILNNLMNKSPRKQSRRSRSKSTHVNIDKNVSDKKPTSNNDKTNSNKEYLENSRRSTNESSNKQQRNDRNRKSSAVRNRIDAVLRKQLQENCSFSHHESNWDSHPRIVDNKTADEYPTINSPRRSKDMSRQTRNNSLAFEDVNDRSVTKKSTSAKTSKEPKSESRAEKEIIHVLSDRKLRSQSISPDKSVSRTKSSSRGMKETQIHVNSSEKIVTSGKLNKTSTSSRKINVTESEDEELDNIVAEENITDGRKSSRKGSDRKLNKSYTTTSKRNTIENDDDEELDNVAPIVEENIIADVNRSKTVSPKKLPNRKLNKTNTSRNRNAMKSDEEFDNVPIIEENILEEVNTPKKSKKSKTTLKNHSIDDNNVNNVDANLNIPITNGSVTKNPIANTSLSGYNESRSSNQISTESKSDHEKKVASKKTIQKISDKRSKASSSRTQASSSTSEENKPIFKVPKAKKANKKKSESISEDSIGCRRSGRERRPPPSICTGYVMVATQREVEAYTFPSLRTVSKKTKKSMSVRDPSFSTHSKSTKNVRPSNKNVQKKNLIVNIEKISTEIELSPNLKRHLTSSEKEVSVDDSKKQPKNRKTNPIARKLTFSSASSTMPTEDSQVNTIPNNSYLPNIENSLGNSVSNIEIIPDIENYLENSVNDVGNVSSGRQRSKDRYIRTVKLPGKIERKPKDGKSLSNKILKVVSKNKPRTSKFSTTEQESEHGNSVNIDRKAIQLSMLQSQIQQDDTISLLLNEELVSIKYVHNNSAFNYSEKQNIWCTKTVENVDGSQTMLLKIPPRSKTSYKISKNPSTYVVMAGEGRIQVQNKFSNFNTTSQIAIPAGVPYIIFNTNPETFLSLCCFKSPS